MDLVNVPAKFEVRIALPFPEIIGGIQKNWAVPECTHAPFSPKFLTGFCPDPQNVTAKFESRNFIGS